MPLLNLRELKLIGTKNLNMILILIFTWIFSILGNSWAIALGSWFWSHLVLTILMTIFLA
jgi:hypothetical protein